MDATVPSVRATPKRLAALRRVLYDAVGDGAVAGGVILLAEAGKMACAVAQGWADREAGRAMRRTERFRYASLTKLIVSVAALRLCETGVLDLDAPVARWLPDFRPRLVDGRCPDIAIRHLLSHTSGLSYGFGEPPGNTYERAGISDGLDSVDFGLDENLRRIASVPLAFAPGEGWRYSIATDVLGAAIEQATGTSLPSVVARLVLEPLAMGRTGFRLTPEECVAAPYWDGAGKPERLVGTCWRPVEGGRVRLTADRPRSPGAYPSAGAGAVGTADDYLRLLECLRGGGEPVLGRESTSRLLSSATGDLALDGRGPGWSFGLGPVVLTDPGLAGSRQGRGTWGWCGISGGHYWVDPEARLSLVALTNTGVAGAWGAFAEAIVAAIYR